MRPAETEQTLRQEITELRARLEKSEEFLRESRARYQILFDSIDDGFCIIQMLFDDDGRPVDYRFLEVSPLFEKHTGLGNALGKTILELVPNHEASWFEIYGKVALTGESIHCDGNAEGLHRWYEVHASRFGFPENRQVAVLFKDVTARKISEQALLQNEALFATIIDQAPGGVYVIDDAFKMMRVNTLARPNFAAAEPIIGRDFNEIMAILWGPDMGPKLSAIFKKTLDTGERYVSPRFTDHRHDLNLEQSYDWETQGITLPNGSHGVVCYYTDTTEQHALERALRASEQRATDIIQSISDGFITMDTGWRITYLSARGAEILSPLQKTTSNVLGKVFWEEFPPTVGTEIEISYRRAMTEKVPVQFETFYPPLQSWFDIRAYPSPSGLTIYFLDVTERKKIEIALAEQAKSRTPARLSRSPRFHQKPTVRYAC